MKRIAIVAGLGPLIFLWASGFDQVHLAPITGALASVLVTREDPKDGSAQPPADVTLSAGELEHGVADVYQRVSRAVVWWSDPESGRMARSGVIVTADGLVLIAATAKGRRLTFQLPDGRCVRGTTLGWSGEFDVGMARLDGPEDWPHVKLAGAAVRAGQRVITLGHATSEPPGLFPRPLLGVGRVTESAAGHWFRTSDVSTSLWRWPATVFDLDGNLAGVGWMLWGDEKAVYTGSNVLGTLWDGLAAGDNLDLVRLGGSRGKDEGETGLRDLDGRAVVSAAAVTKARAATVRIRRRAEDHGFSGVVISPEGIVATCAHHFWLPGTAVIISLPDGRDAAGRVLGVNRVCDIGIVRITDGGPWPHVQKGDSARLRASDACLSIGYGPVESQDRQPSVRRSSVVASGSDAWEYLLGTDPSTKLVGGDSGGGVFDSEGRLVAIHQRLGGVGPDGKLRPHLHPRVELFDRHWEELNAPFEQSSDSPLAAAEAALKRVTNVASNCVVEVLDGDRPVALGVVVRRDGFILTKASDLPGVPACRLSDGRTLAASVVKVSGAHDLVTLKVEAADLSVAEWSETPVPRVGTILVVSTPGGGIAPGFVAHPPVSIPAERGVLWVRFRDGELGLEVAKVIEDFGLPILREGDVVQSIDGNEVHGLKDYQKLCDPSVGSLVWVAGDRPRVVVKRAGAVVCLHPRTGPQSLARSNDLSPRCSGFAHAYAVTMDGKPLLGGPVIDRAGKVAGLAIAWRAAGCLLVLPSTTAKEIAAGFAEQPASCP